MSFLPEHDRDFFECKEIVTEEVVDGSSRGVVMKCVPIPPGLFRREGGGLVRCSAVDVLVTVPDGYNDTKLDSFYVDPPLFLENGTAPQNTSETQLFGHAWQFWSRHQDGWRAGIDGFDTFLPLIREALLAK
jgi:hypothetical protein